MACSRISSAEWRWSRLWKALLAAVSGLNPKFAGRTISILAVVCCRMGIIFSYKEKRALVKKDELIVQSLPTAPYKYSNQVPLFSAQ
jgi:hypothetical protein